MSKNDLAVMQEAVDMLRQLEDFDHFTEMADVVGRLQDKLAISTNSHKPVVHFDNVPNLKGIRMLSPLYILFPYLLKEFRNRWFLFGSIFDTLKLFNLPLDRIESFEPFDMPFRDNPDFDPEHFFDDLIGVSKNLNSRPRTIRFWASAEQSKYIETKPIHRSQRLVSRNPDDGSCIFKIEVVINLEMYSVFMSYGSGVRILSPRKARQYMLDELKKSLSQYESDEQ